MSLICAIKFQFKVSGQGAKWSFKNASNDCSAIRYALWDLNLPASSDKIQYSSPTTHPSEPMTSCKNNFQGQMIYSMVV